MKHILFAGCLCALPIGFNRASSANAQTAAAISEPAATRHGLFGWLDRRSAYGQGVFPEPFLVDDSDLEPAEARLDWLHTEAHGAKSDVVKAEVEKGFGLMTLEAEVPYERDRAAGQTTCGFDNIDAGARCPLLQFVSKSGLVD